MSNIFLFRALKAHLSNPSYSIKFLCVALAYRNKQQGVLEYGGHKQGNRRIFKKNTGS